MPRLDSIAFAAAFLAVHLYLTGTSHDTVGWIVLIGGSLWSGFVWETLGRKIF